MLRMLGVAGLEAVTCLAADISKAQIPEGKRWLSKMLSLEQREFNSPTISTFLLLEASTHSDMGL